MLDSLVSSEVICYGHYFARFCYTTNVLLVFERQFLTFTEKKACLRCLHSVENIAFDKALT